MKILGVTLSTWKQICYGLVLSTLPVAAQSTVTPAGNERTDLERLGKALYFDASLSTPPGQSCATCHTPAAGFADPNRSLGVSRGVLRTRTGFRNAPTASYAKFIPPLQYDQENETYFGGLFLDGRVNSLAEQAQFPFLNPVEMHNADQLSVILKVSKANYTNLFKKVFGAAALNTNNYAAAYQQMTAAIAAFEMTPMFSPFNSKFDYYLKGRAKLNAAEARGFALFTGKANCAACHPATAAEGQPGPMFTDFTYDNIGIPRNTNVPFLNLPPDLNPGGPGFVDLGLANTVGGSTGADWSGFFRVATLRNLSTSGPYGHNGYFKTLKEVVHFYNTRDVEGAGWPAAEIPTTINVDELGDLGLTDKEENDVVEFLKTLTDNFHGPFSR